MAGGQAYSYAVYPEGKGRLAGKVCIITGGTSGIGRECVLLFAREGAKVAFCGRGEAVGKEVEQQAGANTFFQRADVTQEEDIKSLVDNTIAKWGRLDCIFNNAGGGEGEGFNPLNSVERVTKQQLQGILSLNLDSTAFGMKYAIPHLKKQERSSIINCSSVAAKRAGFGDAIYSAAKAGIESYTRVSAMELAKYGVRVNCIAPGATATPIFWSGSPGNRRGQKLSKDDNAVRQQKVEQNILDNVVPLKVGRSGTGYDIATCALFLASDESMWVTAQSIYVDGGLTTFDWPNKGWMGDEKPQDPVPLRKGLAPGQKAPRQPGQAGQDGAAGSKKAKL